MEKLHFLLIPLMSQSHIIPLTDFAKLLAKRGVTVSIITTPSNADRYNDSVKIPAAKSNLKIQLITVEFPCQQAGLPHGCENMDSLASMDLVIDFFQASDMLREPLEKIVSQLDPKPSCIVDTSAFSWTQDIATKLHIPRYVFQTVSCFTNVISHILKETKAADTDSGTFLIPRIPDNIELRKGQLMENTVKHSDKWVGIMDRIKKAHDLARGNLINSFEELEPWYVNEYKKLRRAVWCVGPVSLCNRETDEKRNRGNRFSSDQDCLPWLDTMKPRSVIYACFGSLCQISPSQLKEIGLGLEASNSPFIWVIRGINFSSQVEKWLEEDGLEERVKGRALIVRGWAPQLEILSHPSIRGFMTHCGWNSALEAVSAGVPMITFPMFAEQFFNEKFIVKVLKIGVRVGVEVGVNSWQEEKKGVMVKREQVKNAIDCLMGDEGEEMSKRAQKLAEMAKKAGEEGGSSSFNISLLIQDVIDATCEVKM
ncbi:UDP-glycosyltransferase 73C5-like [Ipomoea triloba]|uniref:UDP-glycosyltransferase 73C5-like n=1 Tax=Ipomoea triloba TaxID=35885 RepID=UPI00125DA1BE|nr:UDP-glycosyltransferase 73C5-like [Ipomoea triloba]